MQIVTGTGLVLLIAGAVCLIAAVILLIRALHTDWTVSVSDYDKKFMRETAIAPSQVAYEGQRHEIAEELGIRTRNTPPDPPVRPASDDPDITRYEPGDGNGSHTEKLI